MSTLLYLEASPRGNRSVSSDVAATFLSTWRETHGDGDVVHRDIGTHSIPHIGLELIDSVDARATKDEEGATALRERLIGELIAADAVLVSSPMYNFSIPSTLKAWIDHVFVTGRTAFESGDGPLAGRPITVITAFGGGYGPGTPREDFDFVRPYLQTIFAKCFGMDLEIIAIELTAAVHTEALTPLLPLHHESLRLGRASATRRGGLQKLDTLTSP